MGKALSHERNVLLQKNKDIIQNAPPELKDFMDNVLRRTSALALHYKNQAIFRTVEESRVTRAPTKALEVADSAE